MKFCGFTLGRILSVLTSVGCVFTSFPTFAQRPLGIDVYVGSGSIDWPTVASSGVSFAWSKAAEGTATDGWIGEDPNYVYNVTHAASAGIVSGSYYYCHPESDPGTSGADAEAAFFWSVANPYLVGGGKYLEPMLDFEQNVTGYGYTASSLSAWLNEWCNDIENDAAGHGNVVKPVVYTFISYANGGGGYGPGFDSTVTQWGLDMANVPYTDPQSGGPAATYPWSTWAFWQYNWYQSVPGVPGNSQGQCDQDTFNGTFASMQAYVIGGTNAQFYYWDPQGTTGGNPYTGNMSASWESSSWTTDYAGQASPGPWPEGNAVVFGVNTGAGTPAYTVTANSNHTFAGIFDGPLNPNSCHVTVAGNGVLTLALGPQGFSMITASDGSTASITISNVIAGASLVVPEGFGTLSLYGTNTFSAGMLLGYPGNPFTGTINFNNSSSFGTGGITLGVLGTGATLAGQGSSPINIANAFTLTNSTTNTFIGTTAGVTYSGAWNLNANTLTYLTGNTAANNDAITGIISGTGALTVGGAGTLVLGGANTYTGNTTVTGGTVKLSTSGTIPSASSVFLANGASINMNGRSDTIATLNSLLGGTLPAGNIVNNNGNLTITGAGTTNTGEAGSSAYSGAISGSGGLIISGGTTTLSGANSYSGATSLTAGTLMPAFNGAIPSASAVTLSGGTLDIGSISQSIASLAGSGTVYLESATLTNGGSASTTFSGTIANAAAPYNNGASINGLQGFYFPNYNFTGTPVLRTDANVNFTNLATNTQPLYPQVTQFSVRWLGQLLTTGNAGSYTFATTSDDGSRLWVNGKLVVDNWDFQPATSRTGTIALAANTKYDMRLDYEQAGGGASCVLSWVPPGGVSNLIASSNLFTWAGNGGISKIGTGTLTLNGTNTYAGPTTITAGLLALGSTGSINNSSKIILGPTAVLDVSASSSCTLSVNTTFIASGNSAAPAAIKGGTTVNFGSQPIMLTNDGVSPSLTISQGALSLNGNAFTVNAAPPLSPGAHTIIRQYTGSISATGTFSVGGTAIPLSGATGSISVAGSNVVLIITDSTVTSLNPPAPSTYGQPATLTATVSPQPPGGTVQFYDNGALLGAPVAIAAGSASFTTNTLAVGTHPITASYSGTTGFAASATAGPSTQTVVLGPNNVAVNIYGALVQPDGTLQLNFSGVPGYTYYIQSSPTLAPPQWTNVSTNTADVNGLFNFNDVNNTNYPALFYQAVVQ